MRLCKTLLLFLFLCQSALGATLEIKRSLGHSPELGLTLQYLVPNNLPSFDVPLSAIGLHVGIPLFGQTLQVQGVYGDGSGISLYNVEAALRLNVPTPFFTSFIFAGAHYLHYGFLKKDFGYFGPLTGLGFYFPMAKNFLMGLGMKMYLPQKLMLTFGGSFSFLL